MTASRARGRADICHSMAMGAGPIPVVFQHLRRERNVAADAALFEVLGHLEGAAQQAAVDLLLRRDHTATLVAVVGRFKEFDAVLQARLADRAGDLFAAIRAALGASRFELRAGAIALVARARAPRQLYLLGEALRHRCVRTRELAAAALQAVTADYLVRRAAAAPEQVRALCEEGAGLAEALNAAIMQWETHLLPMALTAALWLDDQLHPVLLKKLREPRTRIVRALVECLEGTRDPRLASFAIRALAIPQLRAAAARCIERATDELFQQALLDASWLLSDPVLAQAGRAVRSAAWVEARAAGEREGDLLAESSLRWLDCMGNPPEQRQAGYQELLTVGSSAVRRSVLWRCVEDTGAAPSALLAVIAARQGDELGTIARREIGRRGSSSPPATPPAGEPPAGHLAARYWSLLERDAGQEELAEAARPLRDCPEAVVGFLRQKLASGGTPERIRAMQMALHFGLEARLTDLFLRLANDGDAAVRAQAVAALEHVPGAAAQRVLRRSAGDVVPRVQANAVEALDHRNDPDRAAVTRPRLSSPHARVRANAIKSLLRLEVQEAGAALVKMLEDDARAHRLSGLWVVERLQLGSLLRRVAELSQRDPDEQVRRRAARVVRDLRSSRGGQAGHSP